MFIHIKSILAPLLLASALSFAPTYVLAQVNPEIANCEEIKDEATLTQKGFCEAHPGCRLVFGIQSGCAKAKSFLDRLGSIMKRDSGVDQPEEKKSIFDRLKSFVGIKPNVTSNQVFEASMTDAQLQVQAKDADWKRRSEVIKEQVDKADKKSTVDFASSAGAKGIYVGDVKDGKANGSGTVFWDTGEIQRGSFKDDAKQGEVDQLFSNGRRRLTYQNANKSEGEGLDLLSDGRLYKGGFNDGAWNGEGTLYRPDGSIIAKGVYVNNAPYVAKLYDAAGNVTQEIDKASEERVAAQAQAKLDAQRQLANCDATLAAQEREFEAVNRHPLPEGATPSLKRVMWMTSERIQLLKNNCPQSDKYLQMISEMQTANMQAGKACMQLTASGPCIANPFDGRVTEEMRAEMARIQAQQAAAEAAEQNRKAAELRAIAEREAAAKRAQDLQKIADAMQNLANTLNNRKGVSSSDRTGSCQGEPSCMRRTGSSD